MLLVIASSGCSPKTSNNQNLLINLLRSWEKSNATSGYQLTENIRLLDTRLQLVQERIAQSDSNDRWTKLYDHLTDLTTQVKRVAQSHTVIASLRYEYMYLRHEAIKDAYRKTFEWIYRPRNFQAYDPRSRIDYVKWLQHGYGVYWVTGKPGKLSRSISMYLSSNNKFRFREIYFDEVSLRS